jgi:hypothetical protein
MKPLPKLIKKVMLLDPKTKKEVPSLINRHTGRAQIERSNGRPKDPKGLEVRKAKRRAMDYFNVLMSAKSFLFTDEQIDKMVKDQREAVHSLKGKKDA